MKPQRSSDGLRKVCGCPRRGWAKCPHSWHFSFKPKGGPRERFSLDAHVGKHIESRADAAKLADEYRRAIRAGTFRQPATNGPVRDRLTLAALLATYQRRVLAVERPAAADADAIQIDVITRTGVTLPTGETRAFGDWLVADVNADALQQFKAIRQRKVKDGKRTIGGLVTANRNLRFLSAMFNWAIVADHVTASPFKKATVSTIKQAQEFARDRRLQGDEETRLLAACGPSLRPLVEAAIETGCRKGELLSLQWSQVCGLGGARPHLFLPAMKTKTKTARKVPISVRLGAILEMRRLDPGGAPFPLDAYVFGNAIGERIRTIKTAWALACQRAGITGLRFHDLRREAGSRWLDGQIPLSKIQRWLGHANVSQTSTYLGVREDDEDDAMRAYEARRTVPSMLTEARLSPLATGGRAEGAKPGGSGETVN